MTPEEMEAVAFRLLDHARLIREAEYDQEVAEFFERRLEGQRHAFMEDVSQTEARLAGHFAWLDQWYAQHQRAAA
jgi:hypothetical protein